MLKLILTRGLPASGKTTFAKELIAKDHSYKAVCRDEIRNMLSNRFDVIDEELVNVIQDNIIKTTLASGFNVIVHNTHLLNRTLNKLHKIAENIGDIMVIEEVFNTPLNECLRRNALRTGSALVPELVMRSMAKSAGFDKGHTFIRKETFYGKKTVIPVIQNKSHPKAIICDLDGTAALMNGRNPYDAKNSDKDLPNIPVVKCVMAMHKKGYKIIFMSGRADEFRDPTIQFINKHFAQIDETITGINKVIPYELFMRKTGDQRKDAVVKRELFDTNITGKYYIEFCLDDRDQVVENWRAMGLTCFQVAPGDF
jgi:predicted kinase